MSFQAYLDTIEKRTGKIPAEFLAEAEALGFNRETKAAVVVNWLKSEYGLGHGHAMALYQVIKNGVEIGDKHVGSPGSHRDDSPTLRIDGLAAR